MDFGRNRKISVGLNYPMDVKNKVDVSVSVSDYRIQEYQTLRAEKLFRYDYANRMVTTLITATISVWTLDFALFGVNFSNYLPDAIVSTRVRCMLELAQALIFLIPGWLSVVIFENSLRNSIRITLISDYLRAQFESLFQHIEMEKEEEEEVWMPRLLSWEKTKKENNLNYFVDIDSTSYNGNNQKVPLRVGELKEAHSFISFASIGVCFFMLASIACNCMPNCCPNDLLKIDQDDNSSVITDLRTFAETEPNEKQLIIVVVDSVNSEETVKSEDKEGEKSDMDVKTKNNMVFKPFLYMGYLFSSICFVRFGKNLIYCEAFSDLYQVFLFMVALALASCSLIWPCNVGSIIWSLCKEFHEISKLPVRTEQFIAVSSSLSSWFLFILTSVMLFLLAHYTPVYRLELQKTNELIRVNQNKVMEYAKSLNQPD